MQKHTLYGVLLILCVPQIYGWDNSKPLNFRDFRAIERGYDRAPALPTFYRPYPRYQRDTPEKFARDFMLACKDFVEVVNVIPTKEERRRTRKPLDGAMIAELRLVAKKFENLALRLKSTRHSLSFEDHLMHDALFTVHNIALTIIDFLGPIHYRAILRVPFEVHVAIMEKEDAAPALVRVLRNMFILVADLKGSYAQMLNEAIATIIDPYLDEHTEVC